MDKLLLRQVFAANVAKRMEQTEHLRTQTAVAKKAGITQAYLSELLRGMSAPSTDTLAGLATAFGCQPWELLADSEATRKSAMERMLFSNILAFPQEAVAPPQREEPAPKREAARRRKKAPRGEAPH